MWALNEGDMHFVSVHILKLMSSFGPPGNHIQGNILHTPGQLIPKPAQSTSSHVHHQTFPIFVSPFCKTRVQACLSYCFVFNTNTNSLSYILESS